MLNYQRVDELLVPPQMAQLFDQINGSMGESKTHDESH